MSKLNAISKLWRGRIVCVVAGLLVIVLSTVNAQAVQLTTFVSPQSPTNLISRAWLPAVTNNYPWAKSKTGMHLGNRPGDNNDWNTPTDYLARLKGTSSGPWPAATVVLSNQVYNVTRSGTGCETISVTVRDQYAFNYLKQAAQRGTKIIIRFANATDIANQEFFIPANEPNTEWYARLV